MKLMGNTMNEIATWAANGDPLGKNETVPPPSPTRKPIIHSPPAQQPKGKNKMSTTTIIAIAVPVAIAVGSLQGTEVRFCRTRKRLGFHTSLLSGREQGGLSRTVAAAVSWSCEILEIINGKKINNFHQTDEDDDLFSYVWKHWNSGTPLELLDPSLGSSYPRNEAIQCIHIGLLCVQEDPTLRPPMAAVVLMLNSFSVTLQAPRRPASFLIPSRDTDVPVSDCSSPSKSVPSVNEASISDIVPR
ncbi:hypothetical protein F3Y22_tig00111070pilonHSYRG00020 [Hibiscus syriacus]|uniref:Uncharacterized protein n=1 Tax=Hibiscus syriacus TaxID=106335 RepID=A0A6A2Z3W0_HIBSY|nr:hypothetical protein F3Y22_tig00111070pilonHSYRG00020 [Hibiscus syriacus]